MHTCIHTLCIFCSGNQLGPDGWGAVLEAAERLKALTAVEPLGAAWVDVREGKLLALDLNGRRDQGLVAACMTRYLWRSASCLTSIDIRRAHRIPWSLLCMCSRRQSRSLLSISLLLQRHGRLICAYLITKMRNKSY